MPRPRNNEKLISFLQEELRRVITKIDVAVVNENFASAQIYKEWRDSLVIAINMRLPSLETNTRKSWGGIADADSPTSYEVGGDK